MKRLLFRQVLFTIFYNIRASAKIITWYPAVSGYISITPQGINKLAVTPVGAIPFASNNNTTIGELINLDDATPYCIEIID